MKINEIVSCIEEFAPLSLQEDYDNAGLIIGHNNTVTGVLLSLDVTEEIVKEAIEKNINLIITHHPLIFSGLKKITGKNYIERTVIMAIKNEIAVYSAHTNVDNVKDGVNFAICEKLNLVNSKILLPKKSELLKFVAFVPEDKAKEVRGAIFKAGAGHIGNYDSCSFNLTGEGSFRGGVNTDPYVGKKGVLHFEKEIRIETIIEKSKKAKIIQALINAHPYEEVAYDIYPLENIYSNVGSGMIGELEKPLDELAFFDKLKEVFNLKVIRHTKLFGNKIKKVAVCGGSGSFLLKNAISKKADIFISADFKYHQFFDAENKIVIADIGHFESEQCILNIFYKILTKNFSNFAIHLSEINTNPINYY